MLISGLFFVKKLKVLLIPSPSVYHIWVPENKDLDMQ
jgi:hypothetical protein